MRIQRRVIVRRPVEEVFAFFAHLDKFALWFPAFALLEPRPLQFGLVFTVHEERDDLATDVRYEVQDYQENRRVALVVTRTFNYTTDELGIPYTISFSLKAVPEGTLVTCVMRGNRYSYEAGDRLATSAWIDERLEVLKGLVEG